LIDVEYAVERDANFLNEYFEDEVRRQKDPENMVYVRQPVTETSAFTVLAKKRMVPYRTVVERLPELTGYLIETPLGTSGFDLDVTGRASYLRFLPSNTDPLNSERMARADLKTVLSYPMGRSKLFRVLPFIETRVTAWEEDEVRENSIERFTVATGARVGMHLSRIFDVSSTFLDMNGLKHVIDPEVSYRNVFENNVEPDELFQYDETETVDNFEAFTFSVRNFLFVRPFRAPSGEAVGGEANSADPNSADPGPTRKLLEAEVEIDYFPDPTRDNIGDSWGPVVGEILFYPRPGWSVFGDGEFDVEQGGKFLEWNSGVGIPVSEDLDVYFQNRYRQHLSQTLTGTIRARISPRYEVAAQYQFDVRRNEATNQNYALARYFHRWAVVFSVEVDEGEDDNVEFKVQFGPRELLGILTGKGFTGGDL
jgi:hypothetical protein